MKTGLMLVILFSLGYAGCGVKGDPLPPSTEPNIGRGRPTYKKAVEELSKKSKKKSTQKKGN